MQLGKRLFKLFSVMAACVATLQCCQLTGIAQEAQRSSNELAFPMGLPSVPSDLRFESGQASALRKPSTRPTTDANIGSHSLMRQPHNEGVVRVAQLTEEDFQFTATDAEPNQENLLAPPREQTLSVPMPPANRTVDGLQVRGQNQTVSIFAEAVDIRLVLAHLAEESKVNIVVAENVEATVTTTLNNVPLWEALDAILKINGLVWVRQGEIVFVSKPGAATEGGVAGITHGVKLQVFDLNYTAATEVLEVVNGLLSPSGKAFVHAVDPSAPRQTRERIVVEDFPDRIEAIAQYLATVDSAPKQVLIEASVMQVTLDDDQRHGVNLLGLARIAGARVNVQAQGFANASASPGFMMGLEGNDLNGMIEMLQSQSNVRTLAAPKVLVVNGQEARIQIGSKFGYFVTTTTQTSTLQSVDFLDIGVVLTVTPTITQDGRVMISVLPKVSGGRVNPDTGLPEEDTTEAETTVLLPDGRGMIIGGLIKESDTHSKSWVPWIGEQPFIGKLFSRENDEVQRVEVIIALTPHIVPYTCSVDQREYEDYINANSSLYTEDHYINAETAESFEMLPNPQGIQFQVGDQGLIEGVPGGRRVSIQPTTPIQSGQPIYQGVTPNNNVTPLPIRVP